MWPPADGKPYRPANGTEGSCFHEGWCGRCRLDQPFRDGDAGNSCRIVANALAFDVGHPEYPKEWVWKDGSPACTAFQDVDQPAPVITPEERAANLPLF